MLILIVAFSKQLVHYRQGGGFGGPGGGARGGGGVWAATRVSTRKLTWGFSTSKQLEHGKQWGGRGVGVGLGGAFVRYNMKYRGRLLGTHLKGRGQLLVVSHEEHTC